MGNFKWVSVILALFLVVGCAGLQSNTQEGAYYKALGVWYDTGMQFKRYYLAADPEKQAVWDVEFRPMLIKSLVILDIWYVHMVDGLATNEVIEMWQ